MMRNSTDLIVDQLAAELKPVKPLRSPMIYAALWLAVSTVFIAVLVLRHGMRPDIGILLAAVREQFHRVDSGAGLGTVQAWALSIIEAQPGIGVARLASALDVCQPTASNVVKSLCGRGLIERRRGASDRRTVQLFVLDEGRSLLPRARSVFSGPLASALSTLDAKTLLELGEDLRKVLARMPSASAAQRHRRSTEPDGAA